MATRPVQARKPKGKPAVKQAGGVKGALTRKIGPLPFWAWAAIGFAGVYYWRHRSSAPAASTVGLTTPASTAAGLGDLGTGSGSSGGGSSSPLDTGSLTSPDLGTIPFGGTFGASPTAQAGVTPVSANTNYLLPTPASSANFAAEASAKSAAAIAAGANPRFGGVVATPTLATGAQLTRYASGRTVEQAPGKSAYVTSAGRGAPSVARPAASPPAAKKAVPSAYHRRTVASLH